MTRKEKIALLEECMDLDTGTLSPEDEISSYDEWDSVTFLSLIAAADERLHKTLTGQDLKKVKTVADVLALLE